MKLYKIIQEQEEETPKKIRKITSGHKRMLNALSRMEIDSDSYSAIWHEVRDVFQINDDDLAQEITYLYHEYDWVFDEDKKISYQDLPDDALSGFDSLTSSYDSSHIALSMHLDSPPFLISYDGWSHFDLLVYEDLTDGTKYAVGDEDEVESSMLEWAQEYFDNEGIEYMDRYYLDDFIELHDIGSFVDEEVESRVSDMDDEEIIEEAGYDKEEMVDNRDSKESEVTELRDDMETLLNEVEELQSELDDMEEEDDEAYETSEYQEIVNQQDELKEQAEQAENALYGHLTPKLLVQEMHALAELTGKKALKGFKIVVTHLKPPATNIIKIKEQLAIENDLELDLYFPEQGVRFEL